MNQVADLRTQPGGWSKNAVTLWRAVPFAAASAAAR
jgi:hypothetical protein